MSLRLSLHAPRQARRALAERCADSTELSLLDDVTMLTSEIVSNAVLHSGRPDGDEILVEARVSERVFRVEVTDNGRGVETLEPLSREPPSGLGYVHLLSDRWSSRQGDSFHVWFEIDVVPHTVLHRAPA